MLSRFLRRHPQAEPQTAQAPAGSRIYAIGDIHGRLDLLCKLQTMIIDDADTFRGARKLVIYLGDYIDRGPESRAVIEHLVENPLKGFESVFLKGNHEETLLQFLDDPEVAAGWLQYGGDATLYSYGVAPPFCAGAHEVALAQAALAATLPAAHLSFLQATKNLHIEGDYAFVHAGLREGVPIELQSVKDMLWIRGEFLESQADFGKVVVHGHSITEMPIVRCNRIGVDTGAFATGRLTSVVLEGSAKRFIAT